MAARKLTVFSDTRAQLAVFVSDFKSLIVDCSDKEGMQSAKDSRKEIRDVRSNLEDLRKEAKAPYLAKGTQVDDEAKAIKEKLDALFTKFDGAIKAVENKAQIDAQKKLDDAAAKVKDLDEREAAIIAKEIELGLRDAPEEADEPDDSVDTSEEDSQDGVDSSPAASGSANTDSTADIETICEPHIKIAGERLKVLKAIRNLVEPSDAQPEGRIDENIAEAHDAILADIWEIVDVFK